LKTAAAACAVSIANPGLNNFSIAADADLSELENATILQLQNDFKSGKITSQWLTERYLKRIEQIDKSGPAINSVIELNPEAMDIAAALDKERKEKGVRGPLHGIPILIKDNIDTADRMMTTAGSLALVGAKPKQDAFVAERLRKAGAIILGKTNLSEWANFRSTHSTSGWSGRGGQTKNPYALDRNPCGSSSGSGAATAANLCTAAIGTETDGSIVCPSTHCSLVGIKPTLGLVSRAGIIPIAHTQDTAGPMTRNVTDAAILLGALTGIDPRDPATNESQGKMLNDYTKFLDADGLRGARIGVHRKSFGFNDKVDALMTDAIKVLKDRGAVIVDPADMVIPSDFYDTEFEVLMFEFKTDLNAYLAGLGPEAPVHSLKEIIDFNEKNRDKEMPFFGQDIMIKSEGKGPLTSKEYLDALKKNKEIAREKGIDLAIQTHKVDALIAPTGSPAWLTDYVNGDHFIGGYSSASAVSGYPHITVPVGYVSGLPIGISFFAGAYSEPTLIKLAFAFEQATKARRTPQFLSSAKIASNGSTGQKVKAFLA
ncbi:MAG TPA: amidase, partial [Acidobacteriota bacterium]|nr:amidase [Acidobacteriota bacterium]